MRAFTADAAASLLLPLLPRHSPSLTRLAHPALYTLFFLLQIPCIALHLGLASMQHVQQALLTETGRTASPCPAEPTTRAGTACPRPAAPLRQARPPCLHGGREKKQEELRKPSMSVSPRLDLDRACRHRCVQWYAHDAAPHSQVQLPAVSTCAHTQPAVEWPCRSRRDVSNHGHRCCTAREQGASRAAIGCKDVRMPDAMQLASRQPEGKGAAG